MNRLKLLAILLVCSFASPSLADGLQMGSALKQDHITAAADESVEFEALVWTFDATPYPVRFYVDNAPAGWVVLVNPDRINLSRDEPSLEAMALPGNRLANARKVGILVKISDDSGEGEYKITVNAVAGNPEDGVTILQERKFSMTVNVIEGRQHNPAAKEISFIDSIMSTITGAVSSREFSYLATVAILLLILIAAWAIYKHE